MDSLLEKGEKNRSYGETDMNAKSSRSHVIFKIILESVPVSGAKGVAKQSKSPKSWDKMKQKGTVSMASVYLVDLAGSERQGKTQATGERLREGIKINQSLSTLGIVINDLVAGE